MRCRCATAQASLHTKSRDTSSRTAPPAHNLHFVPVGIRSRARPLLPNPAPYSWRPLQLAGSGKGKEKNMKLHARLLRQLQSLTLLPMHEMTRWRSSCCCCNVCCKLQPPCSATAGKPEDVRKEAVRSHDERVGVNMTAGGRFCRGDGGGSAGCDCDETDEKSRKTCSNACISCSSPSPSTSTHWKTASLRTPPSQNT